MGIFDTIFNSPQFQQFKVEQAAILGGAVGGAFYLITTFVKP